MFLAYHVKFKKVNGKGGPTDVGNAILDGSIFCRDQMPYILG